MAKSDKSAGDASGAADPNTDAPREGSGQTSDVKADQTAAGEEQADDPLEKFAHVLEGLADGFKQIAEAVASIDERVAALEQRKPDEATREVALEAVREAMRHVGGEFEGLPQKVADMQAIVGKLKHFT